MGFAGSFIGLIAALIVGNWLGIVCYVLGIIGAALAFSNLNIAGVLMLAIAIVSIFLSLPLSPALAGGLLLLVAGILANREYAHETEETDGIDENSNLLNCIKCWWNANKKP